MSLSIGARGNLVLKLQKKLTEVGHDPGPLDAVFGPRTRKALVGFQRAAKLRPDGVLGPITREALGLDIDLHVPPWTRQSFRALIQANPNYFGTLTNSPFEAIAVQAGDTTYEQLVCIGYQPELDRLEAIVHVKLGAGYGGPVCGPGSREYVRFFVDWNNDGNWSDLGVAGFTAHDIPEPDSLHYSVHVPLSPVRRRCTIPFLPRVRALLSWNDVPPPGDPNYVPPWGNALDTTIQIQARPQWIFETIPNLSSDLVELINQQIESVGEQLIPQPTLPQLAVAYAKAKVPIQRFAAAFLLGLVANKSSSEIAALTPMIQQQLGIANLGELLEQLLEPGDGNQSYEELRCVGYDRDRQALTAVIAIKQSQGYGGGLCQRGTREYVSFWVWDEDGASWSRLGTASVAVHDVPVPKGGIDYAVVLPVDLTRYQRPCEQGFTSLRVRAILSWNGVVTQPEEVPYWGGRAEVTIEVKPGPAIATGMQLPLLDSVGDIAVCDIDVATGYANGEGITTAGRADDAPFGGTITITGSFANPPSTLAAAKPKYRVSVRPYAPSLPESANPWQPLTNDFRIDVTTSIGGGAALHSQISQVTDSEGWYTYQEVFGPGEWRFVSGRVLARWPTHTPRGIYEIRVEGKDVHGNVLPAAILHCDDGTLRQTVIVRLDNEQPKADLRITGVVRKGANVVTPAGDCGKFHVGDKLVGTYVATDVNFGSAGLVLQPNPTPSPPVPVTPPVLLGVSSYVGGLNPYGEFGGSWELDTTGMRPCGYTLTLAVVDRTIVDSSTLDHWRNSMTVGFCLEAAATMIE